MPDTSKPPTHADDPPSRLAAATAALLGLGLATAACTGAGASTTTRSTTGVTTPAGARTPPAPDTGAAVTPPSAPTLGPLGDQFHADVLVRQPDPLDAKATDRLSKLADSQMVGMRLATVSVQPASTAGVAPAAPAGQLRVAGVDPARFRSFTPPVTAQVTEVWDALNGGAAMVSYDASRRLNLTLGSTIVLQAPGQTPLTVRLGALADSAVPDVDLVLSNAVADRLGLAADPNAELLAGNGDNATALSAAARDAMPKATEVYLLTDKPVVDQRAFFSSGEMAKAFGTLPYKELPGGIIEPDPAWVHANIVRAQVPIIGWVTCHRLMIGPLSNALAEVQRSGLADKIHPEQYEGCYVPKLIEDSDAVSLHTWGIAVDLNVPTNQRGTAGDMDPQVVAIFKRWGFRWGGDYTTVPDPMHFELVALPKP